MAHSSAIKFLLSRIFGKTRFWLPLWVVIRSILTHLLIKLDWHHTEAARYYVCIGSRKIFIIYYAIVETSKKKKNRYIFFFFFIPNSDNKIFGTADLKPLFTGGDKIRV